MKSDFRDQLGRPSADGPIAAVVVALEAQGRQEEPDSLIVELQLTNVGDRRVEVLNPFEMVQFLLIDEAGFPVTVPFRLPRLLVGPDVNSPNAPPVEPAQPVVSFLRDGQPGAPSDLRRPTLVLEPGGEVRVAMAIGMSGSTAGRTEPLPDGTYQVGAILTVIDALSPAQSRILQAAPVKVAWTRR